MARSRLPLGPGLLLASLVLLLAGCGGGPAAFTGHVMSTAYDVPPIELTDADGAPFSLASDTDKRLTLVFFGYTHCPDICGLVMGNLAAAMTRLDPADRDQVDVVFVTTDPARDDPHVLKGYLAHYDQGFLGLTGPLRQIVTLGKSLGVFIEKGRKLPGGGYDVTHATQVLGMDQNHRVPVVWTQDTSPAQFADDIHQLLQDPK